MSTAPTIWNPLRAAICRATAAPIGPSPTSITRIVMMRLLSDETLDYMMYSICARVLSRSLALHGRGGVGPARHGAARPLPSRPSTSLPDALSPRNASYDIDVRLDPPHGR